MTATSLHTHRAGPRVLPALPHPREALRHLGPNWYAAVMGTSIIGGGAHALDLLGTPVRGLNTIALVFWVLSAAALVALVIARTAHVVLFRTEARAQLLDNPATAVFYGCPPMALLAVGSVTLAVGPQVIGTSAALTADWVLWSVGAVYGLAVAVGIPCLMAARFRLHPSEANPTWLLPVVAPMVAAALGPALVPHLAPGQPRATMLYACYAMYGMSLLATLLMLPALWSRLAHTGIAPLTLTPTLFLVLGPLGQSVTAVNQIADAAPAAVPHGAPAMSAFAVAYGVPVIGFALMWLVLALVLNIRALRAGMPFAMTWWAFTFPLGTCVTGSAALAARTGLTAFTVLAVTLFVLLVVAWAAAAAHTVRGAVTGRIFLPPTPAPAPVAAPVAVPA